MAASEIAFQMVFKVELYLLLNEIIPSKNKIIPSKNKIT